MKGVKKGLTLVHKRGRLGYKEKGELIDEVTPDEGAIV